MQSDVLLKELKDSFVYQLSSEDMPDCSNL